MKILNRILFIVGITSNCISSEPTPTSIIRAQDYILQHPESFVLFKTSNLIEFKPHPLLGPIFLKWIECKPTFVMKIENGKIYGKDGAIITPKHQVIKESVFNWSFNEFNSLIFHQPYLPDVTYLDLNIANVSFTTAENYYHWMLDILPKFELLKEANIEPDLYYLNYSQLSFQKETLQEFGVLNKIYVPDEDSHIQAHNVIAVSTPEAHLGCPPKWVINLLRKKFLYNFNKKGWRNIYISRSGAASRRIINEGELIKFLNKYNFEIFQLEKLSVKEQAKIFNESNIIVAPHGAGLTNIIFCNPKSKLIEIYGPEFKTPCFWNISQLMGLTHTCIQSKNNYNKFFDSIVDINELEKILYFMPHE